MTRTCILKVLEKMKKSELSRMANISPSMVAKAEQETLSGEKAWKVEKRSADEWKLCWYAGWRYADRQNQKPGTRTRNY